MSHWKLYLFGSPRLEHKGQSLPINLRKALALFAYLAVTRQPHSRDALATLFWPERDQQGARANLRRTLYDLGQLLGAQLLAITSETVMMAATDVLWIDTDAFRHCLANHLPTDELAGPVTVEHLTALVEAADLYTDDFLAGFTLADCPAFEDWLFFQREELRSAYARLLQALVSFYTAQVKPEEAVRYARRWLLLDPLEEPVHRHLMRLYAQAGQQAAALRQYEECVSILQEELSSLPLAETTALYEAIRTKRFPPPDQKAGRPDDKMTRRQDDKVPLPVNSAHLVIPSSGHPNISAPPHNLPPQTTPFVGRAAELDELVRRLCDPACRLLTIVGPGGIGKTRLALAAAQRILESSATVQHNPKSKIGNLQLKDGLFFVPLQSVTTPSGVIPAIADALGFQFYSGGSPQQQVLDFLQEKELLLILDNFEHLLDAVDLVAVLLAGAGGVKLLVTSREALKLHEEWFHPLAGMRLPPSVLPSASDQEHTTLADYDAVQLFIQTARRALVNFQPEAQQAQIVRICRAVDGMPLAVELAASWLKVLSCTQIADEIEHGLDLLVARHQNVSERHRSMRVVMEQSWALLDAEAQAALQSLSLFPGGFAQAAATAVAGADLLILLDLVDKAWIYRLPDERYQMHELLRHFVAAQLAVDPAAETAVRQRHSRYYLDFLMAREQTLVGKGQQQALEQVAAELENIQAGWRWTVQQQDWVTIGRATEALFWFYLMRRRSSEGQEIFTQTVAHLEQSQALSDDPELVILRAILLRKAGVFDFFLGDYAAARAKLEESLAVARHVDRPQEVAYALNVLGVLLGWQGEQAVGIAQLRECLALAQELHDGQTAADAFHELGQLLAHAGDFAEAKTLTLQGLTLCRQLERPDWTAHALDTLGWATFCLGEYEEAARYYAESLSIFDALDHKLGTSLALGGLGLVAWAQGGDRLPEARQLTEQSLAICRTIGNRLHCASHLADLAQMTCELGDCEQALAYGREGVAIARAVGSPVFEAYSLCSLGSAACQLGDLTTARTSLLTAMQTALAAHLLPALAMALFHYAVLLSREGEETGVDAPVPQTKHQQALSLLAGVIAHPACWHIYRKRATALQATVATQVAPELTATAYTYGQGHPLEELATALLAETPLDTSLLEGCVPFLGISRV